MDKVDIPNIVSGLLDIEANQDQFKWEEFKDGIEIYRIYEEENNGPSAALLRYTAGAIAPLHMHTGYEHIFVLSGTQTDGVNEYSKGMLMVSEPGSRHYITSKEGCIVLAIWQNPVSFINPA